MRILPEVPGFTTTQIRERRCPYCVLVFVYNEGERIRSQLKKMRDLTDLVDVVVVDGGSCDGSLDRDFLTENNVTALAVIDRREGLSAQMRVGFAHALDAGYQGIVVIDGNNKDDPAAIPLIVNAIAQGVDHVQGSRFVPGGRHVNTPVVRLWALKILHAPLISLAARHRYTDTTNGFRGYSRRLLTDDQVQPFRKVFKKYELHYFLAIRAARLGFRITEVPVTRIYPAMGKIPTKISPIRGNLAVLATLLKAVMGHYNPRNVISADGRSLCP